MVAYNKRVFTLTLGQSANSTWWKARQGRITSSQFKNVVSSRKPSAVKRCVNQILRPNEGTTYAPCKMGLAQEDNAKAAYARFCARKGEEIEIEPAGLCVSEQYPWLAASPDGIITDKKTGEKRLLEIKCIFDTKAIPRTILEVAKQRGSGFYCKVSDQKLVLRESHSYYFQILGQMGVSGIHKVDFVIYAPRTGEIYQMQFKFDPAAWLRVLQKLESFKNQYLR